MFLFLPGGEEANGSSGAASQVGHSEEAHFPPLLCSIRRAHVPRPAGAMGPLPPRAAGDPAKGPKGLTKRFFSLVAPSHFPLLFCFLVLMGISFQPRALMCV